MVRGLLGVFIGLSLPIAASAGSETRNFTSDGGKTSAASCASAKAKAEQHASRYAQRIAGFGSCDCSKEEVPGHMQLYLGKVQYICRVDVRLAD